MGGRSSRRKGHQFERDVAIWLRGVFPNARRQLEYHSRDARGVDLQETGPYRIQCKKFRQYAPIMCIREIDCDRDLGEIPVLVTAGDGLEPMAVLPLDELLRLIQASQ